MDHGIAVLIIVAVLRYHVIRIEPSMVFVIERMPHWFGCLWNNAYAQIASSPFCRDKVDCYQILGLYVCVEDLQSAPKMVHFYAWMPI